MRARVPLTTTLLLEQRKYNAPGLAEMQKMNRSGHPERIHLLK